MMWFLMGVMCFAAILAVIWPILQDQSRNMALMLSAVVFVVASSAGVYAWIGSPGALAEVGKQPDVGEMVTSLAERLQHEPNDVNGWRMLGRSYMTLGNYAEAVTAYERVVQLESAQNAQSLVDLGEAMLASTGQTMSPQIIALFESALALEPGNPAALFWGGIGAINRGDRDLAADRWERLLNSNPPPEIRDILAQRVAEWRGEPPPPIRQSPAPAGAPAAIVSASIALSDAAANALPDDATVFVIARDPAQPSPPIAVARRHLSELPAVVELGDRESMIPGRELSGFAEFELVARVSISGQPAAQAGDWFGAAIVRPAENGAVELSIDSQVGP